MLSKEILPIAEEECISFPVLCEPAQNFEAETTQGPIKLSDLKGKWMILFSHPSYFTPICTTEFMAFTEIHDELAALNVKLIGLSVDSISAHLAWVRNIKEKMSITIPFPIIADLNMKVAKKYGMIHPAQNSTAAVKCVFFIDDKGDQAGDDLLPAAEWAVHVRDHQARKSAPDDRQIQGIDACQLPAGRQRCRGPAEDRSRDGQAIRRRVRVQRLVPLF